MGRKVRTLQVGNRLLILNGFDPIRYVDLTTNKVHIYKSRKPFKYFVKIINNKEQN